MEGLQGSATVSGSFTYTFTVQADYESILSQLQSNSDVSNISNNAQTLTITFDINDMS